ncbi:immunoglobulin-binding protein 1 [Drosophila takahashii]|uniref:immunoglobulin-binding protein 1 n=1 Tax=Drosophila takahashii TaxID=29030 RepID=UPI001CF8CB3F|nr:immunoglobulin-binding protein 1 [Drosophila takahashii]
MAEGNTAGGEDQKLSDIFLSGWNILDELEVTDLPFNGSEFQNKVKTAMGLFEQATVIVNQVSMFSANELIDEVSTESLPFMLLPYFLGKLTTKINSPTSTQSIELGEIYFKDHLQRCQEYELCGAPKSQQVANQADNQAEKSEQRELMEAAFNRNDKIAQYRRMKEIDEYMAKMRDAVKSKTADDEDKRAFFLKYLDKSIIDSKQELESLTMMKQLAQMRLARMAGGEANDNEVDSFRQGSQPPASSTSRSHGHGHSHGPGHHHHHQQAAKPKPLQPFIITRNATQKAVFGLGYPSLPIMTVDEFYQQRVDEGIFPDEEKVAKMNQAQAIAAARDPNEQEDEEKAAEELQAEQDDPEYIDRMRRMDEYKDVVRRGDGNRHNRS